MENNLTKKENIAAYYKNKYRQNAINKNYKEKERTKIQVHAYKNLLEEDVGYRFMNTLIRRTNKILTKYNINRTFEHMELIGCTKDELKIHLSNQFVEEMSFDNYGEWEIDHIKPISSYNLDNMEEFKECFNYKNLQPLWAKENKIKYNKYSI